MAKVVIGTSQRVLIASSTRDGKSTLAMRIVATLNPERLVVINPGAEPGYDKLFGPPRPTLDPRWPDVQHVAPPLVRDKREYDGLFKAILRQENVLTLIDELYMLATENRFADGLAYLYQMGARRNNGVIAITQRVKRIPAFCVNQADHIIVGHVQGADLEALEFETGQDWRSVIAGRKPYEFFHWSRHQPQQPPQRFT